MHGPGNNYFPFALEISLQRGRSHAFGCDSANRAGAYFFKLASPHSIFAERGADITGTDREYMDAVLLQFDSSSLTDRIERELAGAIAGVKRQWNMTGDAGDINDGPASLLAHHGDNGLHR